MDYNDYKEYLKIATNLCYSKNRTKEIQKILSYIGCDYNVMNFEGGSNIEVNFGNPKFLIGAHYDSVDFSPGANDNIASIVHLLFLSEYCKNKNKDLSILFFDQEEMLCCGGFTKTGSYNYVSEKTSYFGKENFVKEAIILDLCGCGDTIIIDMDNDKISDFLKNRVPKNYVPYRLPTSDNISFRTYQIPSILMTVLPHNEINGTKNTWSRIHSVNDSPNTLEERTFYLVRDALKSFVQ